MLKKAEKLAWTGIERHEYEVKCRKGGKIAPKACTKVGKHMYRRQEEPPVEPGSLKLTFEGKLSSENRWAIMSNIIPWSEEDLMGGHDEQAWAYRFGLILKQFYSLN